MQRQKEKQEKKPNEYKTKYDMLEYIKNSQNRPLRIEW